MKIARTLARPNARDARVGRRDCDGHRPRGRRFPADRGFRDRRWKRGCRCTGHLLGQPVVEGQSGLDGIRSAAFKGYAAEVDPIGCTFTTRPGNSAPPPAGPLPSVITVLVTSSVTKSGSAITGKISEFALVATAAGYDSDPGHPGTGNVISVLPCGGSRAALAADRRCLARSSARHRVRCCSRATAAR